MKILFIGNSYTYYNDMPHTYFDQIAQAAGVDVEVDAITCGGWTLEKFADHRTEFGAQVETALQENRYDAVIVQEQSVRPAAEHGYAAFFDAVRKLQGRISAASPRTVLYQTWGHEAGSDTLKAHRWTNEEMTWRLAASYHAIAAELGLEVACVGHAFFDLLTSAPHIDLYAHDKRSHPSPTGSYLAALVLFARISGIDPLNIPCDGDETPADAQLLREAAHRAHLSPAPIPACYRIASVGISGL